MNQTLVSAHNPMSGPRHLGHYGSTMKDWPALQSDHELFIIIDDLIAGIIQPGQRSQLQNRVFLTAHDFLATGIDTQRCHLVLTSFLPELFELTLLMGTSMDMPYCERRYQESYLGRLHSYQRSELGLARYPSVSETVYPQLALAALTLGLEADSFQGGEEMRGYMDIMTDLAAQSLNGFKPPRLLSNDHSFLLGSNGLHMMADSNAIYLRAPMAQIKGVCEAVDRGDVFAQWYAVLDGPKEADALRGRALESRDREEMANFLESRLQHFREAEITNQQIADALEHGSARARKRLSRTLEKMKQNLGMPGYV
jgi:tryptophanyl-tRNA synthetase